MSVDPKILIGGFFVALAWIFPRASHAEFPVVVDAGGSYACRLASGVVRCWGRDRDGELGDGAPNFGSPQPRRVELPVRVVGLSATGHGCAWSETGRLWCWGRAHYGELGPAAQGLDMSAPVEIPVGPVMAAAAGGAHTCAVTADSVLCWGANFAGQLGNGVVSAYDVPQANPSIVTGLMGTTVALSANNWHTCALSDGGALQCWGDNTFGQLGSHAGDLSPNYPVATSPVTVPLGHVAKSVSVGLDHTCALLDDGSVSCWGHNGYGQSGGDVEQSEQGPTTVIAQGAIAVSAGAFHTCALLVEGAVECWGDNSLEQLGVPGSDLAYTHSPVTVMTAGATSITSGGIFTCSTLMNEDVVCWGSDLEGALGDGVRGGYSALPRRVAASSEIASVSGGVAHSCAVLGDGHAECWGFNRAGVLGGSSETHAEAWSPVAVDRLESETAFQTIKAGGIHTCALDTLGKTFCWGANDVGQLGGPGGSPSQDPVAVNFNESPLTVEVGNGHSCATFTNGPTQCWGAGASGQLGTGIVYADGIAQPQTVKGPNNHFVSVGLGYLHTCGLTSAGKVYCWGDDSAGQIGDGVALPSSATRLQPVLVTALPAPAIAVAAGGFQSCAVLNTGALYCWGALEQMELATTPKLMPMFSQPVKAAAIGNRHLCALLATDQVECTGQNDLGQVGDAISSSARLTASSVDLPAPATSISAGDDFTCARLSTGTAYCWGGNTYGELGSGEPSHRPDPQIVTGLPLFADDFDGGD